MKDKQDFQRKYSDNKECRAWCRCGYAATMMASTEFKICVNCGNKMKNNSKARFKYLMIEKLKEK